MGASLRLGVNIDHVATLRNARGGADPDPLRAARMALEAGADGITAHLREDRRHIRDADIEALAVMLRGLGRPLNFEMAATEEMRDLAQRLRPHAVCLVPERRQERTTEGGLDVLAGQAGLVPMIAGLRQAGARVALFVAAEPEQIAAAHQAGAQAIELHTGAYCDCVRAGQAPQAVAHLAALQAGARQAQALGLEVHSGHGIDFETVSPIAAIPEVQELNIGHFLVGEAVFLGLPAAIGRMRALMQAARAGVCAGPE
jgi:pyridoxine 5-phosphate synthase